MATAFLKAAPAAKKGWLKKLLEFFRRYFNTPALDNLINNIDNLNLRSFAAAFKTGDNLLIKQSEDVTDQLSIRTLRNNDFEEIATIQDNVLICKRLRVR